MVRPKRCLQEACKSSACQGYKPDNLEKGLTLARAQNIPCPWAGHSCLLAEHLVCGWEEEKVA